MRSFVQNHKLTVVSIAVALIAVFTAVAVKFNVQQASAANNACSTPSVVAELSRVPSLSVQGMQKRFPLLSGEPTTAASVNSVPIPAPEYNMFVTLTLANNSSAVHSAPGEAPVGGIKPVLQVKEEVLNHLIDEELLFQEGKHLGLVPSSSEVQAQANQDIKSLQSLSVGSQAYNMFEAYLCVNNLTTGSFASDPLVLQGFQRSLTVSAVEAKVYSGVVPSSGQTSQAQQAARAQALATYLQALRSKASIKIFLTLT
jgi:hypothetical protein